MNLSRAREGCNFRYTTTGNWVERQVNKKKNKKVKKLNVGRVYSSWMS